MSVVAIKTGLGFAAILGIFGVLQSQAVTESLLLFAAAGVIPGTSVELSPNSTLLVVGTVLVVTASLVFRKHIFRHTTVEMTLPQYTQEVPQESCETIPKKQISYLRRFAFNVRLAVYVGGDEAKKFYLNLKFIGRQALTQYKVVYKKLVVMLLSFDYAHTKASIRENLELLDSRLRRFTHHVVAGVNLRIDKTVAHFVRLILR